VVLGHLGAVGLVERVLVIGVLCVPPANGMHDGEVKRQAGCARVGWVQQRFVQYSSQFKSFPDRESPIGKGDGRVGAL